MPTALGQSLQGQAHHQGMQVPPSTGSGDTAPDDLDPAEDSDIQTRLPCITQENHAIKAQLSQLTELVQQLLLQAVQAVPQPANVSNSPPVLLSAEVQSPGTSRATLSLPPPSWSQPREATPREALGNHWAALLSPLRQPSATVSGTTLPAAATPIAQPDRLAPALDAHTQLPWASPASPSTMYQGPGSGHQQLTPATSQPPAQVLASIRGKCSMVST